MKFKCVAKILNRLVGGGGESSERINEAANNSYCLDETLEYEDSLSDSNTQSTEVIPLDENHQTINDDRDETATDIITTSDMSQSDESVERSLLEKRLEVLKTRLEEELRVNILLCKECMAAKETVEELLKKNIKLEQELVRIGDELAKVEAEKNEEIATLKRQEAARRKECARLKECSQLLEKRIEIFSRIVQASIQVEF